MTSNGSARRIAALVMLLLAGILAGAQLAKIAPLVEWYQREAGYSLVTIGWLTSTLGLFVALAALPAAFAIDRAGMYASFVGSSAALALGGVMLASFETPAAVLSGRLVEALGYLVIVIATPALLAALAPERLKAPALAVWGGFVPLGYAFADFAAAALLPAVSPPTYLMIVALCFAASAAAAAVLALGLRPVGGDPAADRVPATIGSTFTVPVGAVAAAFGAYVVLSLGFFSFLPSFAGDGTSAILLSAGFVALLVPFGNVLAGVLVEGRSARFIAWLTVAGFLAGAASAVPFFSSPDPVVATAAAVVFAIAGGIVASALFASIPSVVPAGGSVAVGIGLVAQSGGLGTLIGPPLAGYVISEFAWPGFGWFLAVVSLLGALCLAPMLRAARPAV
ncbi:MFS transporter [Aquibium microcysteis]|uniref:MFS transporter n=1 Tax=Aquibium microcysteis TaxID=675281 RepID=UPI00165D0072|nr:MFS transporter [Aquibium microcysteis]